MNEFQGPGVQTQPVTGIDMTAVQFIASQGIAIISQMSANLIGPSCFQLKFKQRTAGTLFQHGEMGDRIHHLFFLFWSENGC